MRTVMPIFIIGLLVLASCRNPGLPPEAPEHDATNPEVGLVEGGAQADPFTRSAFEGEQLDAGGHEHHHHHGHGKAKAKAEPTEPTEPTESAEPTPEPQGHDTHAGHGEGGRS